MPWFVLYTKARNEKKVTEKLQQLGMEVYCPMVTQMKQWSDRKKKVEVPLLSSYVFVNITERERATVYQVPGVVRYLYWLGKPAIVKDIEVGALKEGLKGIQTSVEVEGMLPGDTIAIINGPFQGKEGIVSQVEKNKIRLVLKELGVLITIAK